MYKLKPNLKLKRDSGPLSGHLWRDSERGTTSVNPGSPGLARSLGGLARIVLGTFLHLWVRSPSADLGRSRPAENLKFLSRSHLKSLAKF